MWRLARLHPGCPPWRHHLGAISAESQDSPNQWSRIRSRTSVAATRGGGPPARACGVWLLRQTLPPLPQDRRQQPLRHRSERVAAAARFDGIYVIRTNVRISPLVVALRYRERWIVDIDQAWRLSRLCGDGRRRRGGRRWDWGRPTAPRCGRGANRPECRNRRIISVHQGELAATGEKCAAA